MIEINVSEFEKDSIDYINKLTDNKGQEIRKEMIKFLKENYWPDSSDYGLILEFINDFFIIQPERLSEKTLSKGSDSLNFMET